MILLFFALTIWDYSFDLTVDAAYDNNIYAYSDEQLSDFENGIRAYRFPFETYDDLRSRALFELFVRNKIFDDKTTTWNLYCGINHYLNNKQKDFQQVKLGLRQSLGTYAVKATFEIIPDYLIRYYRNPEGESVDYLGCHVKYSTVTGKVSYYPKKATAVHVRYRHRWDDYISEFDQYDARNHIIDIGYETKPQRRLKLAVWYSYRANTNEVTEIASSPEADAPEGSHNQHTPYISLSYRFKSFCPTDVGIGYRYTFRHYTTDFSNDTLHYGRQDHMHSVVGDIAWELLTRMYLKIAYARRLRTVTSEIYPEIGAIKDYDKYVLSAGFQFYH